MFYTYCHIRNDTGKIFYIGKGQNKRAFNTTKRSIHWRNVVAKHGRQVEILAYWNTEQEAFEHEKVLISCFKSMCYELVNQTDGGEGLRNPSIETRQKMANAKNGKKLTLEHKQKISASGKGRISPNKGKAMPLEVRQKISMSTKGRKLTLEHRKNLSKAKSLYYATLK